MKPLRAHLLQSRAFIEGFASLSFPSFRLLALSWCWQLCSTALSLSCSLYTHMLKLSFLCQIPLMSCYLLLNGKCRLPNKYFRVSAKKTSTVKECSSPQIYLLKSFISHNLSLGPYWKAESLKKQLSYKFLKVSPDSMWLLSFWKGRIVRELSEHYSLVLMEPQDSRPQHGCYTNLLSSCNQSTWLVMPPGEKEKECLAKGESGIWGERRILK